MAEGDNNIGAADGGQEQPFIDAEHKHIGADEHGQQHLSADDELRREAQSDAQATRTRRLWTLIGVLGFVGTMVVLTGYARVFPPICHSGDACNSREFLDDLMNSLLYLGTFIVGVIAGSSIESK